MLCITYIVWFVGTPSRVYQSTYRCHMPGKLMGTLPRDKRKAAFIGKAVAKGRNTLKKKTSGDRVSIFSCIMVTIDFIG